MSILRPPWRASASVSPTDAHRGLREDRAGHSFMIEAGGSATKLGLGKGGAFADGHGRKVDPVGDIADRPDVADVGLGILVDHHRAALVQRHAGALQPEVGGVGRAAGGEHHLIGLESRAAGEMADDAAGRLFQGIVLAAQHHLDPAPFQFTGQVGAHIVVEAPQDVRAAIDQGGFHTQTIEDSGELHGDVATADDQYPLGQLGQMEGPVGGDGVFDAGDVRRQGRPAAGGDQDLLGGVDRPVAFERDGVGVGQTGSRMHQVGPGVLEIGDVDARQSGYLDVFGVAEGVPVETCLAVRPAEAFGSLESLRELTGVNHEFLWDTASDDAGAADTVFFGDGHAGAAHRREPRRPHPARAGPDDEQVVVVVRHIQLLPRDRG